MYRIIIQITVGEVRKVTTTSQEQATLHLDRFNESCGTVLVEMLPEIKCKEVFRNLVHFLVKLMLTLKSRCIETSKSETTFKCKRKKI